MAKAKVKLNLKLLSVPDKVQYATEVADAMTASVINFTNPNPTVANLRTTAGDLQVAYNDANVTRQLAYTKTAIQNQKEEALDLVLTNMGNYVDTTSNGDESIIKSAGMSTRAKATPVGIPVQVLNLLIKTSANAGELLLKWKAVKGARSYVLRFSTDITNDALWQQGAVVTKASATVSGLKSGVKFWFQVAAVGAAGQGPWSDPATMIAG